MPSPLEEFQRSLSPLGIAPRSGKCMECGKALVPGIDIDHSFCNVCWDDIMSHPYEPYINRFGNEICDTCGEPSEGHKRWKVGGEKNEYREV